MLKFAAGVALTRYSHGVPPGAPEGGSQQIDTESMVTLPSKRLVGASAGVAAVLIGKEGDSNECP
jgi:hypothetical protein